MHGERAPSVRVVSAGALTSSDLQRWSDLQDADPTLASPFFSPEFTLCVAATYKNTFVAVLESGARQVGFFPFQRSGRRGFPVGGRFNDYQGAVLEHGVVLNPVALARACGLWEWTFNHLPVSQTAFAPFRRNLSRSPYIDLSHGFDAYIAERHRAGTKLFATLRNLGRKVEREVGPLQFAATTDDRDLLRRVLQLKSDQFLGTTGTDPLAGSSADFIARVHASQGPGFAGMLSVLFAGDHLLAGHMGLRSRNTWHGWLIAYDPEFARYSPGGLLQLKMTEAAPALGITKFDLGRGEQAYKLRWMSDAIELSEGFVPTTPVADIRRTIEATGRACVMSVLTSSTVTTGVLGPDARLGSPLRTLRGRLRTRSQNRTSVGDA